MEMDQLLFIDLLSLGTFFGMLMLIYLGHYIEHRAIINSPETHNEGFSSIHGALFALLGLLIAFTFTSAYERFDHRRQIIVEEVNDIGTAYLRLDLLPEKNQPVLREKFLQYINGRIVFYQKLIDKNAALAELEKRNRLQDEIWSLSVEATRSPDQHSSRMLLLPALNQMFDISTTRKNAILTHAPIIIICALIGLSFTCALLVGIGMAKPPRINWLHSILFSAIVAFFIYLILDIEYPRHGLVRLDITNELLIELQQDMLHAKST